MPRYYFDVHDGERFTRDEDGLELDDIDAARREATQTLSDISGDGLPDVDRREFVVGVRDGEGTYLLHAVLTFAVVTPNSN